MSNETNQTQALPSGTRIEEFVIERVLGSGGFGMTYLARDTRLDRQVVIKENLPAQFCFRDPSSLTVAPRHTHADDVENFHWSLENFSKESAMLASLDHPGIVKVLRSFESFGTAYFVMPFVDGVTLDELVKQRGGNPFSEEELRGFLERTLSALAYLHERGIYHRDIKPGNILITNDGLPVLIDFGSARQRLSERSLTVVESAGYTPFEQLQSRGNVGPWSDLYALAATLVKMITGETPPKTNDRTMGDPWQPLAGRTDLVGRYSEVFLRCLDRALRLPIEERWQTAGDWRDAFFNGNVQDNGKQQIAAETRLIKQSNGKSKKWIAVAAMLVAVVTASGWLILNDSRLLLSHFSPANGGLVVTSEPSGALVSVLNGGKELGRTPVKISGLNAGEWRGRLSLDGYESADVVAEVVGGEIKLLAPVKLKLAETTKPAQPEKAAEPSTPSKPAETEKTEPAPEPEAPVAPQAPAEPAQPTEPAETIQPTEPDVPKVDASTMIGKVMCGYQGWFRTPGDGENLNWKHYRNQTSRQFKPGEAGIEFWPDLTEFGDHERFDTEFRHADGSVAQVFSSAVRDTVVRHFKWMREYGIDGVFVQRFATEVTNTNGGRADNDESRSVTKVLQHCRVGAARHGRTYAVMYDLTSMSAARMAAVKDDWRFLVKELGILKDPSYQRHAGRPVLALWGVGFRNRDYGPAEIAPLIDFLKNDPECGGLTIMLGTPTHWRAGERDAGPFVDWEKIYKAVDIISPWTIGRYGRINEAQNYAANIAKPDHEWCVANNKEHMPVVFPGFSWSNLKKGTDENPDAFIDRLGGKFLWSQYDAVVRVAGAKMVYQAMFDELDEGTHIFKSTNNPPVGASRFLTYDGLPTDHYLWLVGEATRRVRGEAPFTPELPVSRFDKAPSDTTHHKTLYKQINDNLNSFNKQSITCKLNGVSYWLDAWFKNGEAMKIVAKAQKPDDHMGTEEYYIENSQPLFVFRVSDMLDSGTGEVMKRRAENRFYFRDGRLFKWLKWDKSEMSPDEEIFGHEGDLLSTKCREFISEFGSSSIKNRQEDNNFLDEREWLNAHGKSASEYFDYLSSLQLKRINVEEVIKVHAVKKAEIWNSIPPKSSWRRMGYTLRVVERIAQEMGVDHVDIITAYRSPAYNKQCVRSDCGFDQPHSWHQQNIAVDFSFPGISPDKVTKMAKELRDEGLFRGAVGTHGNFTHLDARGENIDLP